MFNPELEELMTAAIEDGILSDLERRVLFKKAEATGVDPDEFQVILEGRLQRRRRELSTQGAGAAKPTAGIPPIPPIPDARPAAGRRPVAEPRRRESVKMGDIKRCPNCNAVVPPGRVSCAECGYEFRNIDAVGSMDRLNRLLRTKDVSGISDIGRSFVAMINGETTEQQQAKTIRDYPVPNAREDLLEFMITMKARGNKMASINSYTVEGACYNKYMECYEKARIFYADDPQFKPLLEEARRDKRLPGWLILIACFAIPLLLLAIIAYIFS